MNFDSRATQDDESSTLQFRKVAARTVTATDYVLEVVGGPDQGKTFTIRANESGAVYVGKSSASVVHLSDPGVSRRHLALVVEPQGLHMSDLGSTNGTTVNGVRIKEAVLVGGEHLCLGASAIVVRRAAETSLRIGGKTRFGRVLGASPRMQRLYPVLERIALSDVPVIVEGETGTGKELVAEAIHESSSRASKPFVVFDCTTVASNLIESALFGHVRGAFTGATSGRAGVFEEAHEGTLFIDEIGELDTRLQAKLLRAVQQKEVQRIGSNEWLRMDARLIAATRRDLEKEIQAGRFRDDLYYRLAVAQIELPPLRAREGDVEFLARAFWRSLGGQGEIPAEFLEKLGTYDWPGNVRELKNAIVRRVSLGLLREPGEENEWAARTSRDVASREGTAGSDVIDHVIAENLPFSLARQKVLDTFEERWNGWNLDRLRKDHEANINLGLARGTRVSRMQEQLFHRVALHRLPPIGRVVGDSLGQHPCRSRLLL